MPSMKKKTNYEAKGFVRRFMKKGASFKSLGGGDSPKKSFTDSSSSSGRRGNNENSKWRPRKNQFERLDGDDDDSLSAAFHENPSAWNIDNSFSMAESEIGEYRRGIMFEKKVTALKKTPVKKRDEDRKRELTPIKPSSKDTLTINAPPSSSKKAPSKKQRHEMNWDGNSEQDNLNLRTSNATTACDDPISAPPTDSFGFHTHDEKNGLKNPPTISRSSSVTSDPTVFFSKEQATKLTMGNLAKMDSTSTAESPEVKNSSATDGMEKLVRERKFYQFAIDEDKASTVLESTIKLPDDYPGGEYSMDDATEISLDETSQGTRIQQRSVTSQRRQQSIEDDSDFFSKDTKFVTLPKAAPDILQASSSHSLNHAKEVKEFDAFFPSDIGGFMDDQGKKVDNFFPPKIDQDQYFPDFARERGTPNRLSATETDVSSFGADAYFDRHTSSKSLAYSTTPVSNAQKIDNVSQTGRQPLMSKNSQNGSGKKNNFANSRERGTHLQLDDFASGRLLSSTKRHSSISSNNFQPPPTDPFESSPTKIDAKENFVVAPNRHGDPNDSWGMNNNKQYRRSLSRGDHPRRQSLCNDDDSHNNEAEDNFDEIGQWERPRATNIGRAVIASQNRNYPINRARLSRRSNESFNRRSRNQYIDDDDDDAQSASGFSVGKVSRASAKPLGMPSNAIVASMLFQTRQYDINQDDVEEKINEYERENTKQKKVRNSRGGIPDSVNTDDDYMTTVSSFSEGTSTYLQESWRKPSRDLLNHFSNTRALDMEYRRRPVRSAPVTKEQQGLYEA